MDEKFEKIFTNFSNTHEDYLNSIGMSKESFIEQAKQWCQTEEGKLEIQKFILEQEINDLETKIKELEESVSRKKDSILEIDDELSKL